MESKSPIMDKPLNINFLNENIIKEWFRLGGGGLVPLALGLIAGKFFQKEIIYIPQSNGKSLTFNPHGFKDPSQRGMKYRDINVKAKDGITLHNWLVLHPDQSTKRPTVILFFGNAGNMGWRLPYAENYLKTNCNVVLTSYRGYGNSGGTPSQVKMEADTVALFAVIAAQPEVDGKKIFVHGRSLGGAVGAYMATQVPLAGLILENTFTSIPEVGDNLFFPVASKFQEHIMTEFWPTINRIDKIKCPIFFISATADKLIPPFMMQALYDKATSKKKMYKIVGGDHNGAWSMDEGKYAAVIKEFIGETVGI